jgi:hypothetical protein
MGDVNEKIAYYAMRVLSLAEHLPRHPGKITPYLRAEKGSPTKTGADI